MEGHSDLKPISPTVHLHHLLNKKKKFYRRDKNSEKNNKGKIVQGKKEVATTVMIDCGASGVFISQEWVEKQGLETTPRPFILPLRDANKRLLGKVDRQVTISLQLAKHQE
jgi:hypothetical protein